MTSVCDHRWTTRAHDEWLISGGGSHPRQGSYDVHDCGRQPGHTKMHACRWCGRFGGKRSRGHPTSASRLRLPTYRPGNSCTLAGRAHEWEDEGNYFRCQACSSTRTKRRDKGEVTDNDASEDLSASELKPPEAH